MRFHIFFVFVLMFLLSGCSIFQQNFGFLGFQSGKEISQAQLRSIAKQWKNTPYVLGGSSKRGSDCSGFTQSVFSQFNIKIPRTTVAQLSSGRKVAKKDLKTGDLLFFKTGRGPNAMHVGIYLSNNNFIHLSTRGGVKEVSLNETYWKKRYIGAARYS